MNLTTVYRLALAGAGVALLTACGGRALPSTELAERGAAAAVAIEAERAVAVSLVPATPGGGPALVVAPAPAAAYGAGVILDDGYILTSGHLVEGAARVLVRPSGADGPPQAAAVVGVSVCDDLALLQVSDEGLRSASLGASADLRLGLPVVAIGFAPGEAIASPTFSAGSVARIGPTPRGLAEGSLLATSAPLLPGGSGGPLLSQSGEVVGMMAAGRFAAPAGRADYVIGIDYARAVADQLRAGGSVLSLGLDLVELTGEASAPYLQYYGPAAAAGGLFVRSVAPAALTAGVQPGDLLVAIAGRPVGSLADLCGALGGPNVALPAELEVVRRSGEAVVLARASFLGMTAAPPAAALRPEEPAPAAQAALAAPPAPAAPPATPIPAPVAAVGDPGPEVLQAAREALAAERAQHRELFFDTFDSEATKGRWRPADEAAGARQLIYSYYRLSLKQPGAVVGDVWPERPLGPRYIVELELAMPPAGGAAAGIAFDQQTDGSGLSYFVVGADGSWQIASFQGGALLPGRYLRGVSPAFVAGGGTNFLRVVRLPEGTQLWLNDTLVARADPGPFAGGHAGVIAIAGPEPLPEPATVIVDNFRLLEHP